MDSKGPANCIITACDEFHLYEFRIRFSNMRSLSQNLGHQLICDQQMVAVELTILTRPTVVSLG
ncbi:hypothetical protein FRX31_011536 [Thalictrum thalictroides]|uniref:Uncharacterized protein n=1 Tax=Thalictrum thalictroides TaxID=46969 RepID=A0A7J6WPL6_THATH|nr:hypothetical protein FRX31_011536 [Thalictrum thalictroides]